MTTLPKNLESIRDELAKKQMDVCYCSGPTCSGCEYSTEKLVKLAFEVGANEVLKVANKLYAQLDMVMKEGFGNQYDRAALEEWQEFLGEK